MPRGPRLDTPGAFHHVIGRGVVRRDIYRDDEDREDFLARIADLVSAEAWAVYAWALMPNHFHLLVQTRKQSLSRSMRALLSGYAARFNRRHDEVGHLFQNRFKSILCDEERYFHALVRYIHRNPIPGVVPDERSLRCYPFTGHAAILGRHPRTWQECSGLLSRFSRRRRTALESYRRFLEGGDALASGVDLDGGGVRRSRECSRFIDPLERGRERSRAEDRILGSDSFVTRVLEEVAPPPLAVATPSLPEIASLVSARVGVAVESVRGSGRSRLVAFARGGIAWIWVRRMGGTNRELARFLDLSESATLRAVGRGALRSGEWESLLEKLK